MSEQTVSESPLGLATPPPSGAGREWLLLSFSPMQGFSPLPTDENARSLTSPPAKAHVSPAGVSGRKSLARKPFATLSPATNANSSNAQSPVSQLSNSPTKHKGKSKHYGKENKKTAPSSAKVRYLPSLLLPFD